MICIPCRKAGAAARALEGAEPSPATRVLREQAEGHKDCMGGTWCDCQHQTGTWVTSRVDKVFSETG